MYKVCTCTFGRACTFRGMSKALMSDWIEREFKSVQLGDRRLNQRLQQIAADLSREPQATIPQASGSWARTKGAYRFFDHGRVSAEAILDGHRAATLERMESQPTVLLIQDTTSLHYASQESASGLGCLGNQGDKALGLWLHTTLAVNDDGRALGIVQAQMWARDPAQAGIAARRKQRSLADKESQRWLSSFQESIRLAGLLPHSRVINMADREGDMYELFAVAAQHPEVGVLVRARHDRRLQQEEKSLWNFIAAQPVAGQVEITVPRQPGVASHKVELEIRFGVVVLKSKKGHPDPLKLWVVEARQRGGSAEQAICWRLLTNQAVTDLAAAVQRVRWYRRRWRIEEFHRVLKTGCKAEGRQLEKVQRLKNVLALDMIIAWRILELTRAAWQNPDGPATELLTEDEVKILCSLSHHLAGKKSLRLREAVRAIAQWGGFLARKSDGEPGPITLWRGLQRLHEYSAAFDQLSKLVGND
jgi:hypothetical protein